MYLINKTQKLVEYRNKHTPYAKRLKGDKEKMLFRYEYNDTNKVIQEWKVNTLLTKFPQNNVDTKEIQNDNIKLRFCKSLI